MKLPSISHYQYLFLMTIRAAPIDHAELTRRLSKIEGFSISPAVYVTLTVLRKAGYILRGDQRGETPIGPRWHNVYRITAAGTKACDEFADFIAGIIENCEKRAS